jgi:putative ABC transport system permease protein
VRPTRRIQHDVNRILLCFLSYWRQHRLQLSISILGVALGVAVVTAMDLANASALRSFRESITKIAGKSTHQIVAADGALGGVPEDLVAEVLRIPGVIAAAPVIEGNGIILPNPKATLGNTPKEERERGSSGPGSAGTVVRILGIEPILDEPFRVSEKNKKDDAPTDVNLESSALNDWIVRDNGCVMSSALAQRIHAAVGDEITVLSSGRRQTLRLIATYAASGGFARGGDDILFMDIAAAQERFGQSGALTAIDVILPGGAQLEEVATAIRQRLPHGIALQRPSERAGRTEALLDAFQLNLRALSLLALVVGVFLIHNTLTVAVLQRLPMIGTLRCVGAAAGDVRRAVLIESICLGTIGSLVGILAGTALAGLFLERVGGIVSDLYAHIGAFSIFYDPQALFKGFSLGVIASIIGAWFPSREAAAITPVQILRRSRIERKAQSKWRTLAMIGVVAFFAAAALALLPGSSPLPGLGAAFALALGGAFCSPAITRGISSLLSWRKHPGGESVLWKLAARGLSANLSRTGLAVGALALALSMTVGVALMVSSFRGTLDRWMEQSLQADIYIRPAGPALMRYRAFVPNEVIGQLYKLPEVESVDAFSGRDVVLADDSTILVAATDIAVTFSRGRNRFPFMSGNPDRAYTALLNGAILISESLSRKQHLRVGDELRLPTGDGVRALPIAGIYYEYATDRGVASMDLATYRQLFRDPRPNSISVYLKPGADVDQFRQHVRDTIGAPLGLYVFSNAALREEAFRVFDRTFAITGQLENLSLAVGLCGILSALLALLRERAPEFALLRALGLTASGLSSLIVIEGLLLGLVAFLIACGLGPALAVLLIEVINVRAFGWTILFTMDSGVFLRVLVLTALVSALAAAYPAWRALRANVPHALREE